MEQLKSLAFEIRLSLFPSLLYFVKQEQKCQASRVYSLPWRANLIGTKESVKQEKMDTSMAAVTSRENALLVSNVNLTVGLVH